eukprot:9003291-Karenia_brevis.AAC.1
MAGQPSESLSPLFSEVNPVVWDKFGDGGEMEGLESGEEEGEDALPEGVEGEGLKLAEDGEHTKKILDPSLPTENELKEHYEMGYAVCRSWCDICVRARAKEWDCRRDD